MRVGVIGAGIVGVTTAYELALDGHEVTVYEQRASVAAEASFANAGIAGPGWVTPWAIPGMPGKPMWWLLGRQKALRIGPRIDAATLHWAWKWWRAGKLEANRESWLLIQRLAGLSQERLHRVTHDLELDYERADGCLVLLRGPRQRALAESALAMLADHGVRFETLDAQGCHAVEPGLNPDTALHGGVYLPEAEVGNCRQVAHLLRAKAQRLGVQFRFETRVERLLPGATPQVRHIRCAPAELATANARANMDSNAGPATVPMGFEPVTERFDAVVVCAALGSNALLAPIGLRLPLLPVHGYSVTAPLRERDAPFPAGPRSAVMDLRYQVAISRLGQRIRVAGGAEIASTPHTHHPAVLDTLYKVLNDWFPGAAQMGLAQRWKGAHPALPDGPPVLGCSGIEGVWLNLGHGSSGWALACGCARVLADEIIGRAPALDTTILGVQRLRR